MKIDFCREFGVLFFSSNNIALSLRRGRQVYKCEHSFLDTNIKKIDLFIENYQIQLSTLVLSLYAMLAQTPRLPLRKEGDRRRVPKNALARFWSSGVGGGGRDYILIII